MHRWLPVPRDVLWHCGTSGTPGFRHYHLHHQGQGSQHHLWIRSENLHNDKISDTGSWHSLPFPGTAAALRGFRHYHPHHQGQEQHHPWIRGENLHDDKIGDTGFRHTPLPSLPFPSYVPQDAHSSLPFPTASAPDSPSRQPLTDSCHSLAVRRIVTYGSL